MNHEIAKMLKDKIRFELFYHSNKLVNDSASDSTYHNDRLNVLVEIWSMATKIEQQAVTQ